MWKWSMGKGKLGSSGSLVLLFISLLAIRILTFVTHSLCFLLIFQNLSHNFLLNLCEFLHVPRYYALACFL